MDSSENSPSVGSSPEISSPGGKSRYGRTRRPKITRDFYNIDDIVIDEKTPSASSLKSPLKPSTKDCEIFYEIKDEFKHLDDLGMKVASNFKTNNLQRRLDENIKERKFFKRLPDNKLEVPNVLDVTKVLKLISKPVATFCEEMKSTPKASLKTYTNRRKHVHESDNIIIESFGLPDEPIIPVNSIIAPERDRKIDVEVSPETEVNLANPWMFDEFPAIPVCATAPFVNDLFANKLFNDDADISSVLKVSSISYKRREDPQSGIDIQDGVNAVHKKNEDKNGTGRIRIEKIKRVRGTKVARSFLKNNEDKVKEENLSRNQVPLPMKNVNNEAISEERVNNQILGKSDTSESKKLMGESKHQQKINLGVSNKQTTKKHVPHVQEHIRCSVGNNKKIIKKFQAKEKGIQVEESVHSSEGNEKTVKSAVYVTKKDVKAKMSGHVNTMHEFKKSSIKENEKTVKSAGYVTKKDGKAKMSGQLNTMNEFKKSSSKGSINLIVNHGKLVNKKDKNEGNKNKSKDAVNKSPAANRNGESKNRIILRSSVNNIGKKDEDFSSSTEQDDEKSHASITPKIRSIEKIPKLEYSTTDKLLINPASATCKSRARVVLNPLVYLDKSILSAPSIKPDPETSVDNRKLKLNSSVEKDIDFDVNRGIKQELIDYEIGDLAWAKIGSHPYWPCMITEEPGSKLHKKTVGKYRQPFYHVRFFGDKGRRAWLSGQRMLLFYNHDDLEKISKLLRDEGKIKSSVIKECYEIKANKLATWRSGVREAETLKFKKIEVRLNYFFGASKFEKEELDEGFSIKDEILDEEIVSKKRGHVSGNSGDTPTSSKKLRLRIKEEVEDNEEIAVHEEIKSEEDGAVTKKDPRKSTTNKEIEEKDRQIKYKRQSTEAQKKLTNPRSVQKKIKRNSLEAACSSSQGTDGNEDFAKLRNKRHQIAGEHSNSDTDSKFSDNSSVPASLESQAVLFRRNNIFRGISRDKVCQVCEKGGGEVFKCKGPCNGVSHCDCALSMPITKGEHKRVEAKQEARPQESADPKNSVEIIAVTSKQPLPDLGTAPNFKGLTLAEKIDFRMKEIMKKFDYQSVYSELTDSSGEEFKVDESFEKIEKSKMKSPSKLSLTVTTKPSKKEVPIIKHVTADNINYICVTDESPRDKQQEPIKVEKAALKNLKCSSCCSQQIPPCLVCNRETSKCASKFRQKCSLHPCGKFYHSECLKIWPQTQWSLISSAKNKKSDISYDTFVCPRHVCHTCISDDPRTAAHSRCPSDKLVKCLRCPATYHSSSYCVPAGTHILSTSQIVCPRHYSKQSLTKRRKLQQTINTNWCFICSKGGNLICCETCPTSMHVECLPGDLNQDDIFYCEDCQSGRLPLYDEIVWVKLGTFRWWPALILFPNEVPDNVNNVAHNKGEFVVKFFGTYDHYWVGRGRTFLFQEGDRGPSNSAKKRVDTAFVKAIEEAAAAHHLKRQFKVSKVVDRVMGLKPPPYIRIKVNKPVGNVRLFDGNTSNTTSCDCDPSEPHPCGPDTDCLNRLLLTECNPEVCAAGDRCNNQCFEKRDYPPLLPHRTQVCGWGLKTLAPIRRGQFVIEYVGEIIDDQEYQRRIQKMHEQKEENYYFLTIDKDRTLDAGPKGNVARFMNHCCQPNCETQKWTVNGNTRVGLFAQCDIPAGTELTFNYNLECIGKEKKICRCGADNCSGFIGVKVKSDAPQKKSNKAKRKKTPPPVLEIVPDNPCFICGNLGSVVSCNNRICTKYYHLECVGLKSWPEGGKWVCQWHNCNLCSKRTIRCCVRCVNSFCPTHSEGNVRYDKLLGFVCIEHDPARKISEIEWKTEVNVNVEEDVVTSTTPEDAKSQDDFIDSMSLDMRLKGGWVTSTPLKKSSGKTSQDENIVTSAATISKAIKKSKKNLRIRGRSSSKMIVDQTHIRNTANLFNSNQNEVRLSNSIPVRHLRNRNTSQNLNRANTDKDLPIRKRTRLRNTL